MEIMIVNAATGEVIQRDRTEAEQAQHETDQAEAAAAATDAATQSAAAQAATLAAIAHAKSLGFTDAMIAVMYPNLAMIVP